MSQHELLWSTLLFLFLVASAFAAIFVLMGLIVTAAVFRGKVHLAEIIFGVALVAAICALSQFVMTR